MPHDEPEKMILSHDPVPGYRTSFYAAVIVGSFYLLLVFSGVFSHG